MIAPKSASISRIPMSLSGINPAFIAPATSQNFSGGFSRNSWSGVPRIVVQLPVSRIRCTPYE